MNNIIRIGEHSHTLPPVPKNKKDILFIDEKPQNAFWRRITDYKDIWFQFIPHFTKLYQDATLYDSDDVLASLNKEDSDYIIRIYEQETDRRLNGVWFKNGEELSYITGSHYFLLQWAKMQTLDGGDYPSYREFQRDYFYLIDHCWKSKGVLGLFVSKPKKTGITNIHWSGYYLNKATIMRKQNMGAMNMDEKQAAKTFRDYFLYSYNGLPSPLRPQWKNKSENEGSIIFGKAHNNSKRVKNAYLSDDDSELNTSVFCVPTKAKAFDVAVMNDCWTDEFPKYKTSPAEIFRTNSQAVKIQSVINGRFWITSYTPESDDVSFREARQVFLNSELKTIQPNSDGRTKSGLICYHIPAYAAWEGCFDKYGKCNEKEAMRRNQSERDTAKGNARSLQAIIRQYANDKREAWGSAGAGSVFDNLRIGDLLADIEIDQKNSTGNDYIEGNLIWENNIWNIQRNKRRKGEFSRVKFVPLTESELELGVEGKFRMYQEIPKSQQNLALNFGRDDWNCLLPPPRFPSVIGGDPTNYAAKSEVIEGSKNGAYVISMPDELADSRARDVVTKVIQIEYYHRPELPEEAFDDFLKLILYTGSLALIEANMPYVATRLLEEGMGKYMLVKDKNGIITLWQRYMGLPHEPEKDYQLIRMTANAVNKDLLEILVRLTKNYFHKPEAGDKDYGKTCKSTRLLQQLMDLDPSDTRVFDLFMAFGYALLAMDTYLDYLMTAQSEEQDPENISSVLSAFEL
jgi:hypothetical protein